MTAPWLDALFRPRGVALVGASEARAKPASRPLRFLRRHGWAGAVYPINPNRPTIDGERTWPDIASVPGPVDHAYILLGTEAVPDAIRACGAKGVRVATILAGGFAEEGAEGRAAQEAMAAVARAAGVRLVGPNSLGLADTHSGFLLTANAAFEAPAILRGRLAILSQSGTVIGTLLSRGQARGIGFAKMISVGNEADLGVAEIGLALADDPDIDAFLLFLETIRDAAAMAAFAAAAARQGKPVVAYKLGRSLAAQEVAVSHTGALLGSDAAADAFLRDCGIVRVDHLETLFEVPPLVLRHRPPARPARAVAVVTTTGGGAAMVVDRLGIAGVEAISPSPQTLARFAAAGIAARPSRIFDLTLAGTRPDVVGAVIDVLLQAPEFDAVVAVVGSSAQFYPEQAVAPLAARAGAGRPLVVFIVPEAPAALDLLRAAGIAAFRTPEAAADGIASWLAWRRPPTRRDVPAPEGTLAAIAACAGATVVNEREAQAILAPLGVPFARSCSFAEGQAGVVGWPVAAKVLSRDVPHKTDAGGVVLHIADATALAAAGARIRAAVRAAMPGARIEGVLVQAMEPRGVAEVLLGYRLDPQIGPVVTVGMGGVLAEIYRDVAVRVAPVDDATAADMVGEVRGLAILAGYRGGPRGDAAALARTVVALSRLAAVPAVEEAEINPLIVRAAGDGVVAVDALVRLAGSAR
ncbi:MAG: acetate--CoA ligase family protein [Alphaproteobacteria bacterium]|nr:acetate--CoA ligase family protein [Alphaproteobacteria bacterium]